jgi:RNA-directed DNA polymerase
MSLATPEKIRNLQRKLYLKAKQEPNFRFYQLWDKVWRTDILEHAYRLAKANGGAAGVDGVTFEQIESQGREEWLRSLQEELRSKTYRPQPVRRVTIPKPGGGERPLGIPTIRDRVAQTAVKLVIEPIFEVDLDPEAYGYRPQRSAHDAIQRVHQLLCEGYTDVVDADLSQYFDTIPHAELLQCVARRIVDRQVLEVIKRWLKTPVEERDRNGKRRLRGGRKSRHGTPQGGVISPLLANLYLNRFLKYWRQQGKGTQLRAVVINYADDFVILSRGRAAEALEFTAWTMARIGLTLNRVKTKLVKAKQERFDFLGDTFGPHRYKKDGHGYLGASPSKKSVARLKRKVREVLRPSEVRPWEEVSGRLNRVLVGWSHYFSHGTRLMAYRAVDNYVCERVRGFLRRRRQVSSRGTRQFSDQVVFGKLGVVRLRRIHLGPPPATA